MLLRGVEVEELGEDCSSCSSGNGGADSVFFKNGTETAFSEELDFFIGLESGFKLSSPEDDLSAWGVEGD